MTSISALVHSYCFFSRSLIRANISLVCLLFSELAEETVPEILRCSLTSVVIQLLALGVANVQKFDFMAPPPMDSLLRAVEQLYLLQAIEEKDGTEGKDGETEIIKKKCQIKRKLGSSANIEDEDDEDFRLQLTSLGRTLAHFPLEPTLAKAILSSQQFGCTHEVLSVVAMLSVDSVTFTPRNKKEAVSAIHKKFVSEDGDHVTLLNIHRAYKNNKGNRVSSC